MSAVGFCNIVQCEGLRLSIASGERVDEKVFETLKGFNILQENLMLSTFVSFQVI